MKIVLIIINLAAGTAYSELPAKFETMHQCEAVLRDLVHDAKMKRLPIQYVCGVK